MPILTARAHLLKRLNLIVKGKEPGEPRYVELEWSAAKRRQEAKARKARKTKR